MECFKVMGHMLGTIGLMSAFVLSNRANAQEDSQHDRATIENSVTINSEPAKEAMYREAGEAAITFLSGAAIPEITKAGIANDISSSLDRTIWSGRVGTQLYVVTVRSLPRTNSRPKMRVAMAKIASSQAHSNLLKYKAVLNYCKDQGLANEDAIRNVTFGHTNISFSGSLKDVEHQSDVVGFYAVAYAIAEESRLITALNDESATEVRNAYHLALHNQMKLAIQAKNWSDAYQLWTEMESTQQNSPDAKLDAIQALIELDRVAECVSLATAWLRENGETADVKQIEELAEKMLNVQSIECQEFATTAFSLVADRLTRRSTPKNTR